ncbi:NAD(P)-binding protein [Pseudohyphozyma bogoriensis]|nr:NAD(P)-binding protein [Pseudohyphozyma bogoriensis]
MAPRVFLVTGASSGFGYAMTEEILAQGDIAIATLRTPSALDALVEKHKDHDRLVVLPLDIKIPEQRQKVFDTIKEKYGQLDVVINNAGIVGLLGELEASPDAASRDVFEINVWATLEMTKLAVVFMRETNKNQGGRILNVSSFVGYVAYPGCAIYNASKHALEALMASFAAELDPKWNIQLTLIQPGPFSTNATSSMMIQPPHPAYTDPTLPVAVQREAMKTFVAPGDAVKGAKAIVKVANIKEGNEVPARQPIGSSAVFLVKEGCRVVVEQMEKGTALAAEAD